MVETMEAQYFETTLKNNQKTEVQMFDRRKTDAETNQRKGLISRMFHFFFIPWHKLPGAIHWFLDGITGWKKRLCIILSIPALITIIVLSLGPLLTGYPMVWMGTYVYNYQSVIYPKEIPNVMPVETQEQQNAYDEMHGTAVIDTVIKIGDQMLENWQDNDLWFSSSKSGIFGVDNPRNFQIGQLKMVRFVLFDLQKNYTKNTTNDVFNPKVNTAFNDFSWTSDSWMFPRTEGVYKDGINALKSFRSDIINGNARIYPTTYNASEMIKTMASYLADPARLIESVEATKIPFISSDGNATKVISNKTPAEVPWLEIDDVYYQGQGSLYTAVQVLKALRIDARKAIGSKGGTDASFARVIQRIEENTAYLKDPILVVNETWISPSNCSPLALALQSARNDMEKLATQLNN